MANRKITDLTALTTPAAGDLLPIVDISEGAAADKNKKITYSDLISGALVSGTSVASTSGTSIDFTGIPSRVKRVTVMFNGVSTNGTSNHLIQLGTSGGVVATGYLGSSVDGPTLAGTSFTTGIGLRISNASATAHGAVFISNVTGNAWTASGTLARSDSAAFISTAGSVTLSGALDRVRITTVNGTDAFDAGSINILYE
jgi:hypothetical protein